MGDFDVAALAEQPIALAAAVGVLGILLFIVFGRKSYGPVPSEYAIYRNSPSNISRIKWKMFLWGTV